MSKERSEKSWDEVFAELDAAGPFPDGFLSDADRDTSPPDVNPAVDELFVEEPQEGREASDGRKEK